MTDTKNHQPLTLPLTDFIYNLLENRKAAANSDYVFAGDGKSGYLIEPRRQVQKVIQLSEVSFTLHDLRRTFITIAEGLDISAYALKRLVNHKMSNDVTAGYIISDVERLRKPMEQVSAQLNYLRQSRRLIAGAPQRGCLRAAKAASTYPISTDHIAHLF